MKDSYYLAPFIQRMNAHALDLSMTFGILFPLILALTGPIQYIVAGVVFYVMVFLFPLTLPTCSAVQLGVSSSLNLYPN